MSTENNLLKKWQGRYLKVTILFTRAGVAQQIMVENDNGILLFDTGDGTLRDLLANDIILNGIRGIFYTHGHFDHMGGLHSLFGFLRMIGRKEPLPIYAPEGCTEVFSTVVNFKRCYPDSVPFSIPCHELQPHETIEIGAINVEAFPMIHCGSVDIDVIQEPIPAMGYRISYKGETIAISGDTGLCEALREMVRGADLAIIEATYREKAKMNPAMLEKVHLASDIAEEIGRTAKEYILVHKGKW